VAAFRRHCFYFELASACTCVYPAGTSNKLASKLSFEYAVTSIVISIIEPATGAGGGGALLLLLALALLSLGCCCCFFFPNNPPRLLVIASFGFDGVLSLLEDDLSCCG